MKAAVIDIGTNTFHLLIAEGADSKVREFLYKETIPVKLGEGGITKGKLTDAAIERGIDALKKFSGIISGYEIKDIKVIATAAVRSASNGEDFIKRVKEESGLQIEIVDGDREAELIFTGVKWGVDLGSQTSLIMDIGGGSVEFILCNSSGIQWKKSYPIGAAKLMALYHHSDPISQVEINEIQKYLDEVLQDLKEKCATEKPQILIGSSGSFETFAELVNRKLNMQGSPLNGTEYDINPKQFREIASELLQSTHEERLINPGIIPVRVDMIIVSTIITLYVLDQLSLPKIKLSTYALKEGVLFDLLK
jgi:exopolyphosphatase / guanosine-5'-triphosphate,3'-diphosphate pyrophosphatase